MAKQKKLNSMRLLEKHKITYEVIEYPDTVRDAVEVAAAIDNLPSIVYKTLVVEPSSGGKPLLVMIASNRQLDLKHIAKSAGHKKVQMVSHTDAEKQTGLKVGGISALALTHKNWDVYLDEPATQLQHIVISAGQRGLQIRLQANDLIHILHPKIVAVSKSQT